MKSLISALRKSQLCFSLVPALLLYGLAFTASAQETSYTLEKVYRQAIEGNSFKAYEQLVNIPDPDKNSEAYCFISAYLNNQIEEYSSALESAEVCLHKKILRYPEIFFQAAWAAYKTGNMEKAKVYLIQAKEREPNNEKFEKLTTLLNQSKAKHAGPELKSLEKAYAIETDQQIRAGIYFGYNDNVTAVPDDDSLVTVTGKESGFLGLRINAKHLSLFPSGNKLSTSYDLTTRFYESLSGYDSQFHRFSTLYQHRIDDHTGSQIKAEFNNYMLGDDQFRHQYSLMGGINYRPIWRTRLKLQTALIADDYKRPVSIPSLYRDALSKQLSGTIEQSFNSSRLSLTIGFGVKDADGREYDNDYWYSDVKYTHWFSKVNNSLLSGRPVARLSWQYKTEDYEHPSFFLTAGQSQERNTNKVGLYLGLPVSDGKSFYFSFLHRDQSSNLPVYDFSQNSISFGFNGSF